MAKKKIDTPELLGRLKTLEYNLDALRKELNVQIENVQGLFGADLREVKEYNTKLNGVLTSLEHFLDVRFTFQLNYFRKEKTRLKRLGNLN